MVAASLIWLSVPQLPLEQNSLLTLLPGCTVLEMSPSDEFFQSQAARVNDAQITIQSERQVSETGQEGHTTEELAGAGLKLLDEVGFVGQHRTDMRHLTRSRNEAKWESFQAKHHQTNGHSTDERNDSTG